MRPLHYPPTVSVHALQLPLGQLVRLLVFVLIALIGGASVAPAAAVYPLKKSANGRYLVDQANAPFLMVGDSPQALMVNISEADAEFFFANRASYGINTVWINLLCTSYTGGRGDSSTYDGITPFTAAVPSTSYPDLTTPREAYFARVDRIVALAAQHGILVLFDPIETAGYLPTLLANGTTRCRTYGQYLGNRYKNAPNILWMSGNDFQNWTNSTNDAVVRAVALGIRDNDTNHIHTVELDYPVSTSLNDATWAPIISLNASYTYYPTYAEVLRAYNQWTTTPVFMVEANYEYEDNFGNLGPLSPAILRRQEYWTQLSGATGQLYGNRYTWQFLSNWKSNISTPGSVQLSYMKALFESRAWYDLVPDQNHTVVTAGYGTYGTTGPVTANDYVTAARTPDGALVMAYMPTARTLTVDMTKLRGAATARWFDPSAGTYATIAGSPFANSGSRTFTPAARNAANDSDWVLVLEASGTSDTTDPTPPTNLGAAAVSSSRIDLGWTASTDNVGVTQYAVERSQGSGSTAFSVLGTATTTSFSDVGLPPSTVFNYRVSALDAAGNVSSPSNVASATTLAPPADTTPPSAPGNLTATAAGTSQVNLAWTASTDNVAVTGYRLERSQGAGSTAFAQIASGTTTSYSDTGRSPGTTYNYRVRATDAAGNLSAYSSVATAVTASASDTTPPSVPANVAATAATSTRVDVSWNPSTDNVGVSGYRVERSQGANSNAFSLIATPASNTYSDTSAAAATVYNYRVQANDAAGNTSGYSAVASATTPSTPPANNGLVAAYAFSEGSGGTIADTSGNGNTGTINGATWTTAGRYDNALVFNGSNTLVVVNSSPSLTLTTAMTLEAWVFPTATQSGWRTVVQKQVDAYFLHASNSNGTLRPGGGGTFGSTVANVTSNSALGVSVWSHLALTYDGANLRLYVNGTQVASRARTGTLQTTSSPLRIGGNVPYGEYFVGRIDELRIYNRALTAAELQSDMATPIKPVGNTAPTISAIADQTPAPGSSTGPLAFTVNDAQTPATSLVVAGSSSNTTLVPAANIAFGGSGANRTVTVTPATGQTGTARITVSVSDGQLSANTAFNVTVTTPPVGGGLVAAYSFNAGSGTSTADSSGNGNTGTISGAAWTSSGRFGNALAFDGVSSLVAIPSSSSLNLTTAMTLEAWVFPTANQSGWRTIVQKQVDAYLLHASNSNGALRPAGGGTFGGVNLNAFSPSAIAANAWTHLAVTYDGAAIRLYVNGTLVSTQSRTGSIEVNNHAVRIGGNVPYGEYFQGRIDEVRIYSRALTPAEIQSDMNTPL